MKKMLMFIVLLFLFTIVWGESVILKDGRTFKGDIVGKKSDQIYLNSDGNIYLIKRDLVKEIKNEGNQPITGLIYRKKDFKKEGMNFDNFIELIPKYKIKKDGSIFMPDIQKTHETKLNWKPVMLSVLFAGLAWDYFATAGDISDSIDDIEEANQALPPEYKVSTSKLEKQRTRKKINGSLLSAASVVSFAVSFEKVEIKASPTSVEIGYRF